jgi:ABC-type molybdate transport system permease subunit
MLPILKAMVLVFVCVVGGVALKNYLDTGDFMASMTAMLWPISIAFTVLALILVVVVYQGNMAVRRARRALREIEMIESRFPGMRATHFGHNRDILLTDRASGTIHRELHRGRDF